MVYNTYLPLFMVILGIVSGIVLPTLLKSRTRDSQSDFLHPAIIISLVTIFLFFWLVPRYKKKVLEALKNDQKCMIWRIVLPALRIIQIPQVFSSAGFFLCHSRASEIIVFCSRDFDRPGTTPVFSPWGRPVPCCVERDCCESWMLI